MFQTKFNRSISKTALIAIALLSFFSAKAYHVSTEPQTQNLLFEEATGVNCTSCPTVQPVIEKLETTYPGINIIAIHGYHFANKNYNLATDGGDEIVDYFDIVSYPQAMINRVKFDGMDRRFMSDVFWNNFLPKEAEKVAPVNLWINSWLDKETGIVTIDVEGYCLEDISDREPTINVVMTQDGIQTIQAGQKSSFYTQNHVLRDFITPTWGEEIGEKTKAGDYFKMRYEYTLPETIGIFSVKEENLKFVAFVTEGRINAMNSVSSAITYEPLPEDPEEPDDPEEPEEPEQPDPDNPDDDTTLAVDSLYADTIGAITVYDINGRIVLQGQNAGIDSSCLLPGIYIVKSATKTSKLIIR